MLLKDIDILRTVCEKKTFNRTLMSKTNKRVKKEKLRLNKRKLKLNKIKIPMKETFRKITMILLKLKLKWDAFTHQAVFPVNLLPKFLVHQLLYSMNSGNLLLKVNS